VMPKLLIRVIRPLLHESGLLELLKDNSIKTRLKYYDKVNCLQAK
jgi:hypothetical protein